MRKVDYGLGRFTTCDPLWEKYYAWSPYQYSLNNPVSFFDENGGVVQALDDKAREHIRNSVEVKYRDLVAFKDDGTVYLTEQPKVAPPIKDGDDVYTSNIGALQFLIGVEDIIEVEELPYEESVEVRQNGQLYSTRIQTWTGEPGNGMATFADPNPNLDGHVQSTDGKSHAYISSVQDTKSNGFSGIPTFGSTAAHELYGHIFRYYFGVSYWHTSTSKKPFIRAENNAKGLPEEDNTDDE